LARDSSPVSYGKRRAAVGKLSGLNNEQRTKKAAPAPAKDKMHVTRYESEKLVAYLGKKIKVEQNGKVTTGRLKGAWPLLTLDSVNSIGCLLM
jgi:hypothetical protein